MSYMNWRVLLPQLLSKGLLDILPEAMLDFVY